MRRIPLCDCGPHRCHRCRKSGATQTVVFDGREHLVHAECRRPLERLVEFINRSNRSRASGEEE